MNTMNTVEHDWDRSMMWIDILGEDYMHADRNKKKKMKDNYCKERGLKPFQITTDTVSLGTLSAGTPAATIESFYNYCFAIQGKPTQQKKEETPMRTFEQAQNDYLIQRLNTAYYGKEEEAQEEFGITRPDPKSVKEAIQFIKDGNYTLDEKYNNRSYYCLSEYISWGTKKVDHEGFAAALTLISKAQIAAKDSIMVGTPEAGLKAIQEFEATTFH